MRLLLHLSIFLFMIIETASAAVRLNPLFTYEAFDRAHPEEAGVVRLGGGFRVLVDAPVARTAFEAEVLYTNETTPFANDNSLRETAYRGRIGVNYTVGLIQPLSFNARGGFQYNIINDVYSIKATARQETTSFKHATGYGGAEVLIIPRAGFGVVVGATVSGNEALNKWIPQYYLGILLN